MEGEKCWDEFVQTGQISDYLNYVKESRLEVFNGEKEEGRLCERESDGNRAVGSYHW